MTDVLVIAAGAADRKAILDALAAGNLRTAEVDGGDDWIGRTLEHAPSLIVCVLGNDTAGWIETVRELRENPRTKRVPMLALTEGGVDAEAVRSVGLAPEDCLAKPVAAADLLAAANARLAAAPLAGDDAAQSQGYLAAVIDGIDAGFMVFDADDRLVACNAAARSTYEPIADLLRPGVGFAEMAAAMAGKVVDLDGVSADAWLSDRLDRHGEPHGAFDQRLANGRWLRIRERRTGDGGVVAVETEITDLKIRERTLAEGERLSQNLTDIGIALSAEKNVDRLLEMILLEAKAIAHADGGTIYLYVEGDDSQTRPSGERLDKRSGGDRRSSHDRRDEAEAGEREDAGDAPRRMNGDRRGEVDRRRQTDTLRFAIMRNDTLDIAMGGTTGKAIPFPPLRLYDPETGRGNFKNVATLVALTGATVNIPDAYTDERFDFSGTKAFDEKSGYRSVSFLTIPMKNKADEVIGVLQLINARDGEKGEVTTFDPANQQLIEALASQAAVALDNQMLIEGQRNLLDSFIQLMADAIDEKSPYTGGHCARVPVLTELLAEAACEAATGPFKNFQLTEEEQYELHIAGWMHDCGKVTTPEYVVDKSTKLETIYDRVETIRTRFEILKRDAEIAHLGRLTEEGADRAALEARLEAEIAQIDSDCAFVAECNVGGEFMDDGKKERIKGIAKRRWRGPDGEDQDFLSENEVYNLCIGRGTLTEEERKIINDHIVVTIEMLDKLPFPKALKRVPEYAGGHHEKMDGTGYPRGLTREQMSIPARMMAIADIFEALTAADRPYKKAKTLSASMGIMGRMRDGKHIDSELFELFVESGVYRKYAERFLDPAQIDDVDHDALLGRKADTA